MQASMMPVYGKLDALRDWGHARDYVDAVADAATRQPEDFVIATGRQESVRRFIDNQRLS